MHTTQFRGHLTTDPKVQTLENGSYVCIFRVLCKNPNDEHPIRFNVAARGKLGDACATYLKKGQRVYVEGALRSHAFIRNDQTPGCVFEVDATMLEFLS